MRKKIHSANIHAGKLLSHIYTSRWIKIVLFLKMSKNSDFVQLRGTCILFVGVLFLFIFSVIGQRHLLILVFRCLHGMGTEPTIHLLLHPQIMWLSQQEILICFWRCYSVGYLCNVWCCMKDGFYRPSFFRLRVNQLLSYEKRTKKMHSANLSNAQTQ